MSLKEANYWARNNTHDVVLGSDVDKAIAEKTYRADLPEEKLQEFIDEGMLFIETEGQVVGQMNGLSVYALGDHAFGRPSRITATVGLGKEGVVTIDRESQLSGNIHNKGVLILAGFLKKPLCPEQAPDPVGQSLLRAELWYGGRRQRLPGGTLHPDVRPGRDAPGPKHRHDRFREPAGRGPAHRRGQLEDRGLL